MGLGEPGYTDDLVHRDILDPVRDIVADRGGEQERLLEHRRNLFTQLSNLDLPNIYTIEYNTALIDIISTHQKLNNRRFTGAGSAKETNYSSRLSFKINIGHGRHFVAVGKGHMIKDDMSLNLLSMKVPGILIIFHINRLIQNFEHTFPGSLGLGIVINMEPQSPERPDNEPDQAKECNQFP
ncbi:hypothetical protein D3C72_952960 [compost metagenome]